MWPVVCIYKDETLVLWGCQIIVLLMIVQILLRRPSSCLAFLFYMKHPKLLRVFVQ